MFHHLNSVDHNQLFALAQDISAKRVLPSVYIIMCILMQILKTQKLLPNLEPYFSEEINHNYRKIEIVK